MLALQLKNSYGLVLATVKYVPGHLQNALTKITEFGLDVGDKIIVIEIEEI